MFLLSGCKQPDKDYIDKIQKISTPETLNSIVYDSHDDITVEYHHVHSVNGYNPYVLIRVNNPDIILVFLTKTRIENNMHNDIVIDASKIMDKPYKISDSILDVKYITKSGGIFHANIKKIEDEVNELDN